jgi:hypothetical protein
LDHHSLTEFVCTINGVRVPSEGIEFDFSTVGKYRYMEAYRFVMDNIGVNTANFGNQLTLERWKDGLFCIPIDFTPDRCLSHHPHKPLSGSLDMSFRWGGTGVPSGGLTLCAMACKDDHLLIDKKLNLKTTSYEKMKN